MSENKQPESPASPQPAKQFPKITIPMMLLILIGAYLLAVMVRQPVDELASSVARVAVVDMDRLLRAKGLSVNAKSADAVAGEAEAFARSLKEQMNHLTDSGYVVINSAHLVAWPGAMDRTAEVAAKLGVDLKLVDADEGQRGSRVQDLLSQSNKAKP